MTLWLDVPTVRSQVASYFDADISDISVQDAKNKRKRIDIAFEESVKLDATDISSIKRYLSAIRGGNPELKIFSRDDNIVLGIEANKSVFRESSSEPTDYNRRTK